MPSRASIPSSDPAPDRGFTLVEMLAVLAVLALAAGWVVPRLLATLGARQLDAAVDQVLSELDIARLRAASQGRDALVAFDPTRRLTLVDAQPIAPPWPGEAQLRLLDRPPRLRFHPDYGSSGGTIEVRVGALVRLVRIDPITGRADAPR